MHMYRPIGPDDANSGCVVTLEYPGLGSNEIFPICEPIKAEDYNPLQDLRFTVTYIAKECLKDIDTTAIGDFQTGVVRGIIKACKRKTPAELLENVEKFNAFIIQSRKQLADRPSVMGTPEFVAYVLDQSYARSVSPCVEMLRSYKVFSNYVYGEVKHSLVTEFIEKTNLKPGQCFLDMGSGTGAVTLQVAAQALCESFGIEKMENPATLANKLCHEFVNRLKYYDKPCGPIRLKQGDFLEDEEMHEVLKRADVIFVNNYAFDAELNQRILDRFLDLKDTAQVISLRSFGPVDRRQNFRRSNAIETIFKVKEYHFPQNSVSWMHEAGKYFIHTLNRN